MRVKSRTEDQEKVGGGPQQGGDSELGAGPGSVPSFDTDHPQGLEEAAFPPG